MKGQPRPFKAAPVLKVEPRFPSQWGQPPALPLGRGCSRLCWLPYGAGPLIRNKEASRAVRALPWIPWNPETRPEGLPKTPQGDELGQPQAGGNFSAQLITSLGGGGDGAAL